MLYTQRTFPMEYPLQEADVALVGIPYDSSQTQRQAKYGPFFIRQALRDLEGFDPGTGIDPFGVLKFCDIGDVDIVEGNWELTSERIMDTVSHMFSVNSNILPVFLGGEHLVTLGILMRLKDIFREKITVIHFDAHPDLRTEWKGSKYFHGSWASHILKDKGFELVQIGTRSFDKEQHELQKAVRKEITDTENPVYITIDLDVLDPSIARDVATPEPHGLTMAELYSHLEKACRNRVVGFDIVECAARSVDSNTHIIATHIMKKILGEIWMQRNGTRR
ncbi:MAG: arginase family protein [Candidatus Aenigmarchaeota archaeon]|nr:arginase family protein [Candidatus Aenigmarchaeota archaeon]